MSASETRHLFSTLDYPAPELHAWVADALRLQQNPVSPRELLGRVLALLFFNPSVRTRTSCESAMARLGGHPITLVPGSDTWRFEAGEGVVMDGNTQEHVRELAPVLAGMCHAVGIRKSELITTDATTKGGAASWEELRADRFMRRFAELSSVPVINLESNVWHPMQALADMAAIRTRIPEPRGEKYVLTWAWHPKSLPVATPHSQLAAAASLGMNVTLLRPEGYSLDSEVTEKIRARAESEGGGLRETDDVRGALAGARVVTAKSWGGLGYYGRFEQEACDKEPLRKEWIVDRDKLALTDDAWFMHCLPVRRNVIVTDAVLDGPRALHLDEAEQRLWTAMAVLREFASAR